MTDRSELKGKTVVFKYGGHSMDDPELNAVFAGRIASALKKGLRIAVGHGGGPQISRLLKEQGIASEFKDGLRKTPPEAMRAVIMALAGEVNTWLTGILSAEGVPAVGLTGRDCSFIKAVRHPDPELGLAGTVTSADPRLCSDLMALGYVPVIAPIGTGIEGESLNINADTASGACAGALKADAFILFTDVPGVLSKEKVRFAHLTRREAVSLIENGTVSGGMIPKVQSCLDALSAGCRSAAIFEGAEVAGLDGFLDAMLTEKYGELRTGTVISD